MNSEKELDPEEKQFLSNISLALKGKYVSFQVAAYFHLSCFTAEVGTVISSLPSLRTSCYRNVIYSTISAFVTL